jgi:hypothetical protein
MRFLLDFVSQLKDRSTESPLAGFEHPALDLGEAAEVGQGEVLKNRLDGVEAGFDLSRSWSKRGSVLISWLWLSGQRIPQERFTRRVVRSGAVGGQEGFRFATAERMPADGVGEAALLGVAEGTEGHGHR